jgi:hypothetical protein
MQYAAERVGFSYSYIGDIHANCFKEKEMKEGRGRE